MLNEDFEAARAGFRVGHDDASHFNREYKPHFGKPPMHDVEQLRELSGPSTIYWLFDGDCRTARLIVDRETGGGI